MKVLEAIEILNRMKPDMDLLIEFNGEKKLVQAITVDVEAELKDSSFAKFDRKPLIRGKIV